MGWDFSMIGPEDNDVADTDYTFNVSPMFFKAFGALTGGEGIRGLDGKLGKDAAPILQYAIAAMESASAEYKALNPANGWGSYDGALKLLKTLHSWCVEWPDYLLRVA